MDTYIDNKSYKIYFTNSFERVLTNFVAQHSYSKIVYLFDENTYNYWGAHTCFAKQHILIIKAGETHKNIATCEMLYQQLLALAADRNTLLVNVGGGMLTDLGGFVASTYKRGIHFVNIATTLLASVDASCGGKTAVNIANTKNAIGTFCNPQLVIIDTVFLGTLPQQELLSGFAEIIKHGLIADKNYFETCSALPINTETIHWLPIIKTSVHIKQEIVNQDFEEKHIRKALNAGHTIGHAIETMAINSLVHPYTHGECVAVGLLVEAYIATQKKMLSLTNFERISATLRSLYAVPEILATITNWDTFCTILHNDKKNNDNNINASLLTNIGSCSINCTITTTEIKAALDFCSR